LLSQSFGAGQETKDRSEGAMSFGLMTLSIRALTIMTIIETHTHSIMTDSTTMLNIVTTSICVHGKPVQLNVR
jgi:hypothetical protein